MNYYETVYIIHPALQEGRLHDIVNKFHNKLEGLKGKVLYVNNWGKKKLAYPIDKQKYGTYILCQYSLDNQSIKNLSQELELNPNILRYLITVIDESKILEGPNKLDSDKDTTEKSDKASDTQNKDKQKIELDENITKSKASGEADPEPKASDTQNEDEQKIELDENITKSKASSEADPEPKTSDEEDVQPETSNEEDTKTIDSEEDDKKSSLDSEEK